MPDYLYTDLTALILDCYYQVFRSPSSRGLAEASLRKAMSIALRRRGLRVQQNVSITHRYQEHSIGRGQLDLVVDGKVAVEIKRVAALRERDRLRLKARLFDGGYAVGLLLNFGSKEPQMQRVYEAAHDPKPAAEAEEGREAAK